MIRYIPIEIDISANNLVYIARGDLKFIIEGNEYTSELELDHIDIYTCEAEIFFSGVPLKRQDAWIKKEMDHQNIEFTDKNHFYLNLKS